jgi:hypothetical protein
VRVASDFDNTITARNMGEVLVAHYLFSTRDDPLLSRARRVLGLAKRSLYGAHLESYRDILHRLPRREWTRVLSREPIHLPWARAVQHIRRATGARRISITIISRNTSDVIAAWAAVYRKKLAALGVSIDEIIANKPWGVPGNVHVHVHGKTVRAAGAGRLQQSTKRKYVRGIAHYIGDRDEQFIKPYVRNFYPV